MDKLTFLDNGRHAFKFCGCVYKMEVADKLYAYEDTGLSPEEVQRLKERIGDDKIDKLEETIDNLRFQLSVYKQKLADGRIIELPCKIGDTVYELSYHHCCTCPDWDFYSIDKGRFCLDMLNEVNKTVFLTREEAEQALKECENNA